jgi:hypothetical protein
MALLLTQYTLELFFHINQKKTLANRDLILENLRAELTAKGFEVKIVAGSNADNLKLRKIIM